VSPCSEDYHWWWRSFFTSGSSAVYMFLYSGRGLHSSTFQLNLSASCEIGGAFSGGLGAA